MANIKKIRRRKAKGVDCKWQENVTKDIVNRFEKGGDTKKIF
jgi:hypothetical protein